MSPCVIAGPTCDSVDVLYEKDPYMLPVSLEIGAKVLIEGTGAYTTTYASVGFNGFAPLKVLRDLTASPGAAVRRCAGLLPARKGVAIPAPGFRRGRVGMSLIWGLVAFSPLRSRRRSACAPRVARLRAG